MMVRGIAAGGLILLLALPAPAVSGTVASATGDPLPYTFVGLLSPAFELIGQAVTDASGAFDIPADISEGRLVVQPPARASVADLETYDHQPRIYEWDGTATVSIRLPEAICLVLEAYDPQGRLMRWQDFEYHGQFGGVFAYATNLGDEMAPCVCWPVHDAQSRASGSARETGLPALVVEPGRAFAAQVLFWEVPGYGKMLLRADSAGEGLRGHRAGEAVVVRLNLELARTAVHDLERRYPAFPPFSALDIEQLKQRLQRTEGLESPAEAAGAADAILAEALALRDRLELARARADIPAVRQGSIAFEVRDAAGASLPGCSIHVKQLSHAFLFGVFEGSPFNAPAFQTAREAGFNLATVLPAWGWTDTQADPSWRKTADVLGLPGLRRQGYQIKAHGVCWMQDYGILPERVRTMSPEEIVPAAIEQERALLAEWGDSIGIWEVVNEPATTNAVGLSREAMVELTKASAAAIKELTPGRSLINSPHEVDYGRKYLFFGLDNRPANDYNRTYSAFLKQAQQAGALDQVDIIGLQFYPGYRFNESLGGYQGPGHPPGWLVDTLERYAAFGKPVHITEFSVPSQYGDDWYAGFWREPSTPATQADYLEAVFTIAFGTPGVDSITYWDITDAKPSVLSGGLISAGGAPKPAFDRARDLIQEWTTDETVVSGADGSARLPAFAGAYEAEVTMPDGTTLRQTFEVAAGRTETITIEAGP